MKRLSKMLLLLSVVFVMTTVAACTLTPAKYTITFDSNGGTEIASVEFKRDDVLTAPEDPTKAGFTFEGWYKNEDLSGSAYEFPDKMPTGSFTLYAKWTQAVDVTITFNSNGGTSVAAIAQKSGTALTKPADPTKSGNTFAGWYTDAALTQAYTFPSTMPSASLTLYAKWTPVAGGVTITFNSNGGSAVTAITQAAGSALSKPADPTKSGNTFAGWYTDAALTQAYTFPSTMPAAGLTLYAKWTPTVAQFRTYTFEGAEVDPITARAGNPFVAPDDPSLLDYTFGGWYTESDFSGSAYEFPSAMPDQDITLYAKWNPEEFTIVLDTRGGDPMDPIVLGFDSTVTAPSDPTYAGYTFAGWYEDLEYTTVFTFPTVMPKMNLRAYAKWTAGASTLSFNTNGGSACTAINATTGSVITLPTTTKADRLFAGWYLDAGLTQALNASMPGGNNTAYAKWLLLEPGTRYDMTLTADGVNFSRTDNGDGTYTYSIISAGKGEWNFIGTYVQFDIRAFTHLSIDYELVGSAAIPLQYNLEIGINKLEHNWTPSAVNTRLTETFALTSSILTDGTTRLSSILFPNAGVPGIHATQVKIYRLSLVMAVPEDASANQGIFFNANGVDKTIPAIIAPEGSDITEPSAVPVFPGHIFRFWSLTNDAAAEPFTFDTMPAGPTTLYAIWEALPPQTLTYETFGGTAIAPLEVPYGATLNPPGIPVKPGYIFVFWFADEDCTQVYTFTTMTESHTIYAKWIARESNTYTFETNGGTAVDSITAPYDAEYEIPAAPTKDGFTFAGWYTDASFKNAATLNGRMSYTTTYFAKWISVDDCTLSFVTAGSAVSDITQKGLSAVTVPATTLTGSLFAGWYTDAAYTAMWDGIMPATTTASVYAKFVTAGTAGSYSVLKTSDSWARSASGQFNNPTNTTADSRDFVTASSKNADGYVRVRLTSYDFSNYNIWSISAYANAANKTMRLEIWNQTTNVRLAVSEDFTLGNGAANAATFSLYADLSTVAYANTLELRIYAPNHTGSNLTIYTRSSVITSTTTGTGAARYQVQFNTNYTSSPVYRSFFASGATITAPAAFRSGYTLDGWFSEAECTTPFVMTMGAADTIAYAKWTQNTESATLTFNTRGGNTIAAATQIVGTTVTFTSPTKAGATFNGWYYDTAWTRPFDGVMPAADATLYARWNTYDQSSRFNLMTNIPLGGTAVTVVRTADSYQMTPAAKGTWDCFVFDYTKANLKNDGYAYIIADMKVTWTGTANHTVKLKVQGMSDAAQLENDHTAATSGARYQHVWAVPAANLTNTGGQFVIFLQPGLAGDANATFEFFDISIYRMAPEPAVVG